MKEGSSMSKSRNKSGLAIKPQIVVLVVAILSSASLFTGFSIAQRVFPVVSRRIAYQLPEDVLSAPAYLSSNPRRLYINRMAHSHLPVHKIPIRSNRDYVEPDPNQPTLKEIAHYKSEFKRTSTKHTLEILQELLACGHAIDLMMKNRISRLPRLCCDNNIVGFPILLCNSTRNPLTIPIKDRPKKPKGWPRIFLGSRSRSQDDCHNSYLNGFNDGFKFFSMTQQHERYDNDVQGLLLNVTTSTPTGIRKINKPKPISSTTRKPKRRPTKKKTSTPEPTLSSSTTMKPKKNRPTTKKKKKKKIPSPTPSSTTSTSTTTTTTTTSTTEEPNFEIKRHSPEPYPRPIFDTFSPEYSPEPSLFDMLGDTRSETTTSTTESPDTTEKFTEEETYIGSERVES